MTRATEVFKAEAPVWELERYAGPGGVYHKKLDDLAGLARCKERTLRKRLAQGEQRGAWVYATKPGNPWAPDPTADAGTVLVLNTGAGDFDPIGLLARALRDCRRRGRNQRVIEILSYALSARERCKDLQIETQDRSPSKKRGPCLGTGRPPVRPRSQPRAASDGTGLAKAAGPAAAPAPAQRLRLPDGPPILTTAEVEARLAERCLDGLARLHMPPGSTVPNFAVGEHDQVVYPLLPFVGEVLAASLTEAIKAAGWTLQQPRTAWANNRVQLIEDDGDDEPLPGEIPEPLDDETPLPGELPLGAEEPDDDPVAPTAPPPGPPSRPAPAAQEEGFQGAIAIEAAANVQPIDPDPAPTDEELIAALIDPRVMSDPHAVAGLDRRAGTDRLFDLAGGQEAYSRLLLMALMMETEGTFCPLPLVPRPPAGIDRGGDDLRPAGMALRVVVGRAAEARSLHCGDPNPREATYPDPVVQAGIAQSLAAAAAFNPERRALPFREVEAMAAARPPLPRPTAPQGGRA